VIFIIVLNNYLKTYVIYLIKVMFQKISKIIIIVNKKRW